MSSKQKMINIRGLKKSNDDDIFYRYKMEEVVINQQQTKISFVNVVDICKSLDRTPKLLITFLKKYFSSNFVYKDGIAQTTKLITKLEMQLAIYKFIDDYVLCSKCSNPETIYEETKKKTTLTCKACSYITELL